jgi:hypothetical protein
VTDDTLTISPGPRFYAAMALAIAFAGGQACKSVHSTPLLCAGEALQVTKRAGESGYRPAKAA